MWFGGKGVDFHPWTPWINSQVTWVGVNGGKLTDIHYLHSLLSRLGGLLDNLN
jgi:hypothetical protein